MVCTDRRLSVKRYLTNAARPTAAIVRGSHSLRGAGRSVVPMSAEQRQAAATLAAHRATQRPRAIYTTPPRAAATHSVMPSARFTARSPLCGAPS